LCGYFHGNKKGGEMKVHYQIISDETGRVLLRNRKIAKSLRWWLRENGFSFHQYIIFILMV
jgi:hypothetical protein